jgi:hypothetical protein
MKIYRIYLVFFILTCILSCYHADGIVWENEVEFKLASTENSKILEVYNVYSKKRLLPNNEGIYSFTTPFLRTHSNVFLFVEYESHTTKDVKLLEIRRANDLFAVLSLYEFNQLPTDEKGRYILEIGE